MQETRGQRGLAGGLAPSGRAHRHAEHPADLRRSNHARPQQHGPARIADINDGRFETMTAGTAVENVPDGTPQTRLHMRRGRWTDVTERIGAGRGEGQTAEPEELSQEWMGRHAHRHAGQSGSHDIWNGGRARQHERERSRPEGAGEFRHGVIRFGDARQHAQIGDVDDERVICRTALRAEDLPAGFRIERVGGEAVDGFSRHGHQSAAAENPRQTAESLRSAAVNDGRHGGGRLNQQVVRKRQSAARGDKKAGARAPAVPGLRIVQQLTCGAACGGSA